MMYTICTIYTWWWCHALTYTAQYSSISFHRLGELMKQVVNCTFYIMCLRILDSLGNNLSVSFSCYLSQCTVNAENSAKCQASFESLAGWWSFIINRSLFTLYISWLGYGVAVSLFTRLVRQNETCVRRCCHIEGCCFFAYPTSSGCNPFLTVNTPSTAGVRPTGKKKDQSTSFWR